MANSLEKTEELIRRYMDATGKTLEDITQQGAKIAAEWIAVNATAPIGKSLASKRQGEAAVQRDIRLAVATPAWFFIEIEKNQGPRLAAAFWKAYQKKDLAKLQRLLPGVQLTSDPAAVHQQARINGKVPKRHKTAAMATPAALDGYIAQKIKHVGRAKGGWSDAARALGNARFPAWFKSGEGSATSTASTGGVKVNINSNVPYASALIDSAYKQKALRIGYDRILKMMRAALKPP